MTLRPFTIQSNQYKKRGTLFKIKSHRGEKIAEEIKLHKTFFDKLLSYPITAFGYSIELQDKTREYPNPKFDRHDVIKALDFWIEHWVYQNKKDYLLEGTVNKDFELTVRELIETREAVLKMPAKTEFVRQKIRPIVEIQEIKPKMVEFTENVLDSGNSSSSISTVDQFCYVVRKMTYKEYIEQPKLYNKDVAQGLFSGFFQGSVIELMDQLQRQLTMNQVPVSTGSRGGPDHLLHSNLHPGIPSEQMRAGEFVVWNDETNEFKRVDMTVSDARFTTDPSLTTTDGFFILPIDVTAQSVTIQDDGFERNDFSLVPGELGNMIPNMAVGRARESLRVGDLIIQETDSSFWWVKATDPILPHEHVMVNMEDREEGQIVFAREPWQPIYREIN